jgi:hypothetical protein
VTAESPHDPTLKILSILHYVLGGFYVFFGLFGFIYVVMGAIFMASGDAVTNSSTGEPMPGWFGLVFLLLGIFWVLFGVGGGVLTINAGRYIAKRVKRKFSVVMAYLNCLNIPLGTALGIFTIITLGKPEVKALYGEV